MIPIVSILDLFSALLSTFLFLHIWRGYKKQQNITLKYFALFYLYCTVFFTLAAVPGIITRNGWTIAIAASAAYFFLFVAVAYLLNVTLSIYKYYWWQKWAFTTVIMSGVIIFICNLFVLRPAVELYAPPFTYYLIQEYSVLRIISGAAPLLIALLTVIMFLQQGWRLSHTQQKQGVTESIPPEQGTTTMSTMARRSYIIATGLGILLIGGIVNFIVFSFAPSGGAFLVAAILAACALIVIARGIEA